MEMQKVDVNGIKIAYRWDGNKDGPIIMMAHAMGTSSRIWDLQISALADRYNILRYDWRGHGETSAPVGPYTLDQFVNDAVGTLDALALPKVHWVGISTGGMIGQGLAIKHSNRLESLTLCNTTSQSNPWYRGWVAERQAVVKKSGMNPVWDMTKKLWFTDGFVDAENSDYCNIRDVFVKTPIDGYLGGTSAVADLNYLDSLHLVNLPTRIIAAGEDPVTPIEKSKEIYEKINTSELFIINGQRHFSNVEVPDKFNKLLREGLDKMSSN
jgi:3-oxoadipate enol-lactonase